MTITVTLYSFFEDSTNKDGETGLTVTIDVWRVRKSDLDKSEVVTAGNMTEIGDGVYGYLLTGADPTVYDYIGICKTASTDVVAKHVPAIRWDAAEGWATELGRIDTTISSRSDFDEATDDVIVGSLLLTALQQFVLDDTTETAAVAGSVADLSQCAASGFPAGSITFTYTVTNDATLNPIDNVAVWISTDNPADGNPTNIIWSGMTDAFGIARDILGSMPMLDPGVYYFWRSAPGFSFTNPDTETVSNP